MPGQSPGRHWQGTESAQHAARNSRALVILPDAAGLDTKPQDNRRRTWFVGTMHAIVHVKHDTAMCEVSKFAVGRLYTWCVTCGAAVPAAGAAASCVSAAMANRCCGEAATVPALLLQLALQARFHAAGGQILISAWRQAASCAATPATESLAEMLMTEVWVSAGGLRARAIELLGCGNCSRIGPAACTQ